MIFKEMTHCPICNAEMDSSSFYGDIFCPVFFNKYDSTESNFHRLIIYSFNRIILSYKMERRLVRICLEMEKSKTHIHIYELGRNNKLILFLEFPKIWEFDFPELKLLSNQMQKYCNLSLFF